MATKRPSKQKRAAQNRNQRAAREARAANAHAGPTSSSASSSGAGGARGGLLSRLRGGGGGQPSTRARGAALRPDVPPGFRAALSAVLAAAAALVLVTLVLRYPVDARDDLYSPETLVADWSVSAMRALADQPDADPGAIADSIDDWTPGAGDATVMEALWPYSLATVLPLIGAGLGFQAVRKRSPSKTVNRALYATLFGAVLTQGLLLLFIPVVLAMGVAMFQVRKAEVLARASGDDGVIDVEALDDDELDESERDESDVTLDDDTDLEPVDEDDVIDVDTIDLDAPARDDDVDPPAGAPRA